MNKKVIGALIGLAKTVSNNPKTENTDQLIQSALKDCDNEKWVEYLHEEKYNISPGCKTCAARCGNTDDYDIEAMKKESVEVQTIKNTLIQFCINHAAEEEAKDLILQSLCFVGYELEERYFNGLLKQIEKYESKN